MARPSLAGLAVALLLVAAGPARATSTAGCGPVGFNGFSGVVSGGLVKNVTEGLWVPRELTNFSTSGSCEPRDLLDFILFDGDGLAIGFTMFVALDPDFPVAGKNVRSPIGHPTVFYQWVPDDPAEFDAWVRSQIASSPSAIPEPSTAVLLALGLAGMAAFRRRRP